jgi:nucleoside triphosphate diphosphatase
MGEPLKELIAGLQLDRQRSSWSRSQTLDACLVKLQGEIDECREALASGDVRALTEELGDVLWSLIFAVIVAEEECCLSLDRVAGAAVEKLITRKPWLFQNGPPLSPREEAILWQQAKEREKAARAQPAAGKTV